MSIRWLGLEHDASRSEILVGTIKVAVHGFLLGKAKMAYMAGDFLSVCFMEGSKSGGWIC